MGRENPESYSKSPEFIRVLYDESGRPVGVRPADVQATEEQRPVEQKPQYSFDLTMIGRWLSAVNANVNQLRSEVNTLRTSSPMDNGVHETLNSINERISSLAKEMSNQILANHKLSEDMILLRTRVDEWRSQISEIQMRMDVIERRIPSFEQIDQRFRDIESSMVSTERQLSIKSDELNSRIFNLENRVTESQTVSESMIERINSMAEVMEKIATRMNEISENVERLERENGDKLAHFVTKEDIEKIKSDLETSIILNRISYEMIMKDLVKKKIRKVRTRKVRKIKPRKVKRRVKRRITRRISPKTLRVERILRTRFELRPKQKVLVVAERRLSKYGRIVHNVSRRISKNSILMVIPNRKNEREEIGSLTLDAMRKSEIIFVCFKHSIKRTRSYRELIRKKKKMRFFNKRLIFSK